MSLKSEKRKGWHYEVEEYSKWMHCNSCAAPFLLDDNYIFVRDNGLRHTDRKVFECPICGSTDITYLQEIHLPAIRQMIAVIIVNASEDYIKDRNQFFHGAPLSFFYISFRPKKGKGNNLPVAAAVALPVTPYHERGKLIYKTSFTKVNLIS